LGTFAENNGTFSEKKEHFRIARIFEIFFWCLFASFLLLALVFTLSFDTWTCRGKIEHFEKTRALLRNNWVQPEFWESPL